MERLTYWCDNGHGGGKWFVAIDAEGGEDYGPHVDRLAAYEETGLEPGEIEQLKGEVFGLRLDKQELEQYRALGPIDRLRELAQADSMIGQTVYEPNNRGFISTYKVISIHISGCSVLVGWELLDGIYSNLNGFEISALGKTVFLTREEAEAALRRGQGT